MGAYYIVFVFWIAICGYAAYKVLRGCFDHSITAKGAVLIENATITDMRSEKVRYNLNRAKYKTTVCFSDGFQFITYRTNREDCAFACEISVDTGEITMYAHRAHGRAFSKQEKRKERTAT